MTEYPLILHPADGHVITGQQFVPEQPGAILIISHGMAEHGGRYDELARWLANHDILVITYHHRGHGPQCPPAQRGHYADQDGWRSVVADLSFVINIARQKNPGLPVNLLGHSMGSFIAQACVQDHGQHVDNLILSATNRIHRRHLAGSRLLVNLIALLRGRRHRSRLIDQLTFGQFNRAFRPNRTASDWLSRDEAQVDRYEADPCCGFVCTVGLWQDFIGGMLALSPGSWRPDLPVHLLSGTADAVGEMGKGIRQHAQNLREAGLQQVTLKLFDGGRHEILNETNRDEVWSYVLTLCSVQPTSGHPAQHPDQTPL